MCMLCGENLEEVKSLRILSGELRFPDIFLYNHKQNEHRTQGNLKSKGKLAMYNIIITQNVYGLFIL